MGGNFFARSVNFRRLCGHLSAVSFSPTKTECPGGLFPIGENLVTEAGEQVFQLFQGLVADGQHAAAAFIKIDIDRQPQEIGHLFFQGQGVGILFHRRRRFSGFLTLLPTLGQFFGLADIKPFFYYPTGKSLG